VWDFLPLRVARNSKEFTEHPHLDLMISRTEMSVRMTLANASRPFYRRRLVEAGSEGFQDLLTKFAIAIEKRTGKLGGFPWVWLSQRHFLSQSSPAIPDAQVDFNPITAVQSKSLAPKTKYQPQWIEACYGALCRKHSNLEFAIGARFPYRFARGLNNPMVLGEIAAIWLACEPILNRLKGKSTE
jgi:hypothetical protein